MKKIISFLIIFAIVAIGLYFVKGKLFKLARPTPEMQEAAQEELFSVKRGDLAIKILATGMVQPKTKVEVIALKRGRIDEILVEEGNQINKGQILGWMSSEERIALVDTTLAGLEEAKKSQDEKRIKEAEQELRIAQNTYNQIPIVAPISGTLIFRGVEPGQTVSLDETVFILADVLVVVAQVDEVDIGKVKNGQLVNVTTDAFPDRIYQGKVTKIAYESRVIDNVTYYDITTDLLITDQILKSGMTANVEVIIVKKESALLVPRYAIIKEKEESFVLVKTDQGDYQKRRVKTGLADRKETEIVQGLTEGEKILINVTVLKGQSKDKGTGFKATDLKYFRK